MTQDSGVFSEGQPGPETPDRKLKKVKRQMKFLGAAWQIDGKYGAVVKHRFSQAEIEWMLGKCHADKRGFVEMWTSRIGKRKSPRSASHKNTVYVLEGEWGWDPTMPVKEVKIRVDLLEKYPGSPRIVVSDGKGWRRRIRSRRTSCSMCLLGVRGSPGRGCRSWRRSRRKASRSSLMEAVMLMATFALAAALFVLMLAAIMRNGG
jgi:hypothetical protein